MNRLGKRSERNIEVVDSGWESKLWRPKETFPRSVALIRAAADSNRRLDYIDSPKPYPPREARTAIYDETVMAMPRSERLAHHLHGAIRKFKSENAAVIYRRDIVFGREGKSERQISARWQAQTQSVVDQLRSLERAIHSEKMYKIEKAWFALGREARD